MQSRGRPIIFVSFHPFKCLSQTKACNNFSPGDTAWLFWLCENNFLHVTMIQQQLSSVFWGQWNRHLCREEGKKVSTEERNRNIFKQARIQTQTTFFAVAQWRVCSFSLLWRCFKSSWALSTPVSCTRPNVAKMFCIVTDTVEERWLKEAERA